jgi:hypothetical protein
MENRVKKKLNYHNILSRLYPHLIADVHLTDLSNTYAFSHSMFSHLV